VAATDANILLLGENGTGKELAAYMIHKLSKRKKEVFVRVDLGALSESLFESELFGHRKGAFTDAKTDRTGKMESAKDGTLFLDEIANLSLPIQSKLLTAIQRKSIVPLGSNKEQSVNFRLICATNRNLAELMSKKLFREDLLYRINTIVIEMPPLRKRKEDIEFLAMHFLNNFKEKYSKPKLMIDETGIHRLKDYHWPGNVRELKHTIEKAVILSDSDILTEKNFQLRTLEFKSNVNISPISLEDAEKIVISNALKNNKGNISNTARELKIGRQTLYRKIEKFQLKY
jgi:transcriptional regulator with PAS, ATPase and Fis domain